MQPHPSSTYPTPHPSTPLPLRSIGLCGGKKRVPFFLFMHRTLMNSQISHFGVSGEDGVLHLSFLLKMKTPFSITPTDSLASPITEQTLSLFLINNSTSFVCPLTRESVDIILILTYQNLQSARYLKQKPKTVISPQFSRLLSPGFE